MFSLHRIFLFASRTGKKCACIYRRSTCARAGFACARLLFLFSLAFSTVCVIQSIQVSVYASGTIQMVENENRTCCTINYHDETTKSSSLSSIEEVKNENRRARMQSAWKPWHNPILCVFTCVCVWYVCSVHSIFNEWHRECETWMFRVANTDTLTICSYCHLHRIFIWKACFCVLMSFSGQQQFRANNIYTCVSFQQNEQMKTLNAIILFFCSAARKIVRSERMKRADVFHFSLFILSLVRVVLLLSKNLEIY